MEPYLQALDSVGFCDRGLMVSLVAELVPLFVLFVLPRLCRRGSRGWGLSPTGYEMAAGLMSAVIVVLLFNGEHDWCCHREALRETLVLAPPCSAIFAFGIVYFKCRLSGCPRKPRYH